MPDLAGRLQLIEGLGDLLRLDQCVGPVQQQDVQVFGTQPAQNPIDRGQDVLLGEVEGDVGPDADLGLQQNLFAHSRCHADGVSEDLLAPAFAVDVGMVEEVGAQLHGALDEPLRLRPVERIDTHAADRNDRYLKIAGAQRHRSHEPSLPGPPTPPPWYPPGCRDRFWPVRVECRPPRAGNGD